MAATANVDEWGPNLYAYLERHWRAAGTNANAWTDKNPGIQGPTVSRWRTGTAPSLLNMRAVADALGVPMVEVLAAAGVIDPKETGRKVDLPADPNIDAAIANDPSLSELQRRTLRDMLAAMRRVESGEVERVRGRASGSRRPKR